MLDNLAGEEGVAVGLGVDGVDQLRSNRGAHGRAHQLLDGRPDEPGQPH